MKLNKMKKIGEEIYEISISENAGWKAGCYMVWR